MIKSITVFIFLVFTTTNADSKTVNSWNLFNSNDNPALFQLSNKSQDFESENLDLEEQIKSYTSKIKKDPNTPDNYIFRAHAFFLKSKYRKTLKDLKKSLVLDEKNILAYTLMCDTYFQLKKFKKNINCTDKAIKLLSTYYDYYIKDPLSYDKGSDKIFNNLFSYFFTLKAMSYLSLNNPEEAEKNFIKSIDLNPTFVEPYFYSTNIYIVKGNYKKAQETIKEGLKNVSDTVGLINLYFQSVEIFFFLKSFDESIENAKKLISVFEENKEFVLNLVETPRNQEEEIANILLFSQITSTFEKLYIMQLMTMEIQDALANIDHYVHYTMKNLIEYENTIYRELNNTIHVVRTNNLRERIAMAHFAKANIYSNTSKDRKILYQLNKSKQIYPDIEKNLNFLRFKYDVQFKKDFFHKAITTINKIIKINKGKNSIDYNLRGKTYLRMYKPKKALKDLKKACKLDKIYCEFYNKIIRKNENNTLFDLSISPEKFQKKRKTKKYYKEPFKPIPLDIKNFNEDQLDFIINRK